MSDSLNDELRQCLQIIITNAGNIKDRYGTGSATRKDAIAIEMAVARAVIALDTDSRTRRAR